MDIKQDKKYKDISVEEIITDLYEQHNRCNQKCLLTAKRFFLCAATSVLVGFVVALYQWVVHDASWRWIIVGLCAAAAGGCGFFAVLSLLPLGFNKYAVEDFHILVRRALELKYGNYDAELLEKYMKSEFVLNFINENIIKQTGQSPFTELPRDFYWERYSS